jgi:hypothetical protein
MRSWKLYVQLVVAAATILWGSNYLGRLTYRPELLISWLSVALILIGVALGAWAAYSARRGAGVLGAVLLLFSIYWIWNIHYLYDPRRAPPGDVPINMYLGPGVLIALGVFFCVFFRYLYALPGQSTERLAPAAAPGRPTGSSGAAAPATHVHRTLLTPWYRLLLLGCSAGLALLVATFAGVSDSAHRTEIIISVLVLGCLATGLISEETLTKIVPWKGK